MLALRVPTAAKKTAAVKHVAAAVAHPPGTNKLALLSDQPTIVFPYPHDAGLTALVICNHAGLLIISLHFFPSVSESQIRYLILISMNLNSIQNCTQTKKNRSLSTKPGAAKKTGFLMTRDRLGAVRLTAEHPVAADCGWRRAAALGLKPLAARAPFWN